MPIYIVTAEVGDASARLIEAPTKASAINHVTKGLVTATALSASDVVQHMQQGVPVENVSPKVLEPLNGANPDLEVAAGDLGEAIEEVSENFENADVEGDAMADQAM